MTNEQSAASERVTFERVTFEQLGVRPPLVRALRTRGMTRAFPIQAATLPDALAGRDVLGRGRTGSGKTVAFALPVLERVLSQPGRRRPHRPRAIVLVPTRELAVQVADTMMHLAQAVALSTMTVIGGVRYAGQARRLEQGVDIVVATPGRLEDLVERGVLTFDDVTVAVLDEADMMADLGFMPSVTRIMAALPTGQRMLFSATLDGDVAELVTQYLNDPAEHAIDDGPAAAEQRHHLFVVTMGNKRGVLSDLLRARGRQPLATRTLLFARTKAFAERLASELSAEGVNAVPLHGDLRQASRQRNLAAFAEGRAQVLVATDIAARGIHVDDIGLVVHVDPPVEAKALVHRSGRTARAGARGVVVTLVTHQQVRRVMAMMDAVGIEPVRTEVAPGDEAIREVRASAVVPASASEGQASIFRPDPEDVAEPEGRGRREAPSRRPADASGKERWNDGDRDKRARTRAYLVEHGLSPRKPKRTPPAPAGKRKTSKSKRKRG